MVGNFSHEISAACLFSTYFSILVELNQSQYPAPIS